MALLTAGTVLGSTAIAAVAVFLLAYLRQRGYPLTVAAGATGALGVVQVAGRVALTVSARRLPIARATAVMLGAQVTGVAALLLIPGLTGVILFVLLFGLGFGVLHIARPELLARYAPRRLYARISGIQALLIITGEAAAPTGAAALRAATGSYLPVFTAVATCSLAAALLFLAAEHASHQLPLTPHPAAISS